MRYPHPEPVCHCWQAAVKDEQGAGVPSRNGSDGVRSTALVEYRGRTMRLDEGVELEWPAP